MTMKERTAPWRTADRALEQAAEWLQRLDDPNVEDKDLQAWLGWFGASDENARAFEEVQQLRQQIRELPPELRDELRRRQPRVSHRSWRPTKQLSWALAATVAAIAIALGTWRVFTPPVVNAIYASSLDRHRTIGLADGSVLVLGADSTVEVHFDAEERFVSVERGDAYFEVQHDAARPFVVQANDVRVTAVGTAFRVLRSPAAVTVTVTDGVVEVAGAEENQGGTTGSGSTEDHTGAFGNGSAMERGPVQSKPIRVAVGQRAVIESRGAQTNVRHDGTTTSVQWRDGRVRFVNARLGEVIKVVNDRADRKLGIDDPRVGDLTYSGTIMQSHLQEWIDSLQHIYPVRAVPLDDGSLTLVSASSR